MKNMGDKEVVRIESVDLGSMNDAVDREIQKHHEAFTVHNVIYNEADYGRKHGFVVHRTVIIFRRRGRVQRLLNWVLGIR